MNKQESLHILQQCLDQITEMTPEQFAESLVAKGLADKVYDDNYYQDDSFCLDVSKVTQEDRVEDYQVIYNYTKQANGFYGIEKLAFLECTRGQVSIECELSLAA